MEVDHESSTTLSIPKPKLLEVIDLTLDDEDQKIVIPKKSKMPQALLPPRDNYISLSSSNLEGKVPFLSNTTPHPAIASQQNGQTPPKTNTANYGPVRGSFAKSKPIPQIKQSASQLPLRKGPPKSTSSTTSSSVTPSLPPQSVPKISNGIIPPNPNTGSTKRKLEISDGEASFKKSKSTSNSPRLKETSRIATPSTEDENERRPKRKAAESSREATKKILPFYNPSRIPNANLSSFKAAVSPPQINTLIPKPESSLKDIEVQQTSLGAKKNTRTDVSSHSLLRTDQLIKISCSIRKPYLFAGQRKAARKLFKSDPEMETGLVHVDFTVHEINQILASIGGQVGYLSYPFQSKLELVRRKAQFDQRLAWWVSSDAGLLSRSLEDIKAFLVDIKTGNVAQEAKALTVTHARKGGLSKAILNRSLQIGFVERIGTRRRKIEHLVNERYVLDSYWGSTSGDINTAMWLPDGDRFILGSTVPNDHYNKNNNLMLGRWSTKSIKELPGHRTEPESKYLASHDFMYQTVSDAAVAMPDNCFATASYDNSVKIWKSESEGHLGAQCVETIELPARADLLSYSSRHRRLAVGVQALENSVHIYEHTEDVASMQRTHSFTSPKALQHRDNLIQPSCLEWGTHPQTSNLLLVGYQPTKPGLPPSLSHDGQLKVIDVSQDDAFKDSPKITPDRQAVSACRWMPTEACFITVGPSPTISRKKGVESMVRIFDWRAVTTPKAKAMQEMHWCKGYEWESGSADANLIVLNEKDTNIITVAYDDGSIRIWDRRFPHDILHVLRHRPSLNRSEVDHFGVNFASFGADNETLYSGSSDGVVKSWNYKLSPRKAWIEDVFTTSCGIHSGQFSPDYSKLLIGDSSGHAHILRTSTGGFDDFGGPDETPAEMTYIGETTSEVPAQVHREAAEAAQAYLDSGELIMTERGPFRPVPRQDFVIALNQPNPPETSSGLSVKDQKELRRKNNWLAKEEARLRERGMSMTAVVDRFGELVLDDGYNSDDESFPCLMGFHPDDLIQPLPENPGPDA